MISYREKTTIEATLTFNRDDLVYDIENKCYIEGDIYKHRDEETTLAVRHTTQDVGQKGNIDNITRQLDVRVAEVTEMLLPYSQRDINICENHEAEGHEGAHPLDNKLKKTPQYTISLKLPSDFSETTLTLLENLIHEYLVARCVEEWLSITMPEKAKIWSAKADSIFENIRTSKTRPHMRRKTRRPMHPF